MPGTHARDYDFGLKIHAALDASLKNRREKGTKYNIKKIGVSILFIIPYYCQPIIDYN